MSNKYHPFQSVVQTFITLILGLALGLLAIIQNLTASLPDTVGTPYETAFSQLAQQGIVEGYKDGTGQPYGMLRRSEAIAVILRSKPELMRRVTAYMQQMPPARRFIDEDRSQWYAPYVMVAYEEGIASGYPDNSFRPAQLLRAEEALTILIRALNTSPLEEQFLVSPLIENTPGQWYTPYINTAITRNLILDDGNKLMLGKAITRGEFFDVLYRLQQTEKTRAAKFTSGIPLSPLLDVQMPSVSELPTQAGENVSAGSTTAVPEMPIWGNNNPFGIAIGPAPTNVPANQPDEAIYPTSSQPMVWDTFALNQGISQPTQPIPNNNVYIPTPSQPTVTIQSGQLSSRKSQSSSSARKSSSSSKKTVTTTATNTSRPTSVQTSPSQPLGPVPPAITNLQNVSPATTTNFQNVNPVSTQTVTSGPVINAGPQAGTNNTTGPQINLPAYASLQDFAISLPTLGIENLRVTHPSDAGSQEGMLAVLDYGVGHLFAFPGGGGKIMVYGHSSGYWWDRSEYTRVFRRINELKTGDRVYLTFSKKLYIYEVTGQQTIDASDTQAFQDDGSGEELIMYTCWPPDSVSKRLLVFAKPVSVSNIK